MIADEVRAHATGHDLAPLDRWWRAANSSVGRTNAWLEGIYSETYPDVTLD